MTLIILLFLLCSVLATCLPWSWVRYLILLYSLGVILFWVLLPPVHFMDQSIFHDVIVATLGALSIISGLPFFGRLCWAIHRKTCDFSVHNEIDAVVGFVIGLVLAFLTFLLLSVIMAGTSMLLAHCGAVAIAIFVWPLRHPALRGLAIGLVALISYSLYYPRIVHAAALMHAPSVYTISSSGLSNSANLTFLSMPKFPHPKLHFEQNGARVTLGWSYRRHTFLPLRH